MAAKSVITKIATAATAFALLGSSLPAVSTPAAAKPIKIVKIATKHIHVHRRLYGPGLVIAGVAAASSSCYWLKVRAIRTDSDYWWDRYNTCIGE